MRAPAHAPHGRGKKKAKKGGRRAQATAAVDKPAVHDATGAAAASAGAAPGEEGMCAGQDASACRDGQQGQRELVSVVTPTRGKTQKLLPLLYNRCSLR